MSQSFSTSMLSRYRQALSADISRGNVPSSPSITKMIENEECKNYQTVKKRGFKSLPVVNKAHMKSLLQIRFKSFPWYRVVGFILSAQESQDGYQFPLNSLCLRKLLFKQWWNTLDWQRARSFSQSIVTCIWNQLYTHTHTPQLYMAKKLHEIGFIWAFIFTSLAPILR